MISIPKVDKMTMEQLHSFWSAMGYRTSILTMRTDGGEIREFEVRNDQTWDKSAGHGIAIKVLGTENWDDLAPEFHNAMMQWHYRRLAA